MKKFVLGLVIVMSAALLAFNVARATGNGDTNLNDNENLNQNNNTNKNLQQGRQGATWGFIKTLGDDTERDKNGG